MITPQQIDQVSFSKASFGGYNMQQVDEFLEPLTEDYVTLYKENALLKSKMRVLATKLEEYRRNGVEAKNASADAKAAADKMLLETKAKCDRMLKEAAAKAAAVPAASAAAPAVPSANTEALRTPVWKRPGRLPTPRLPRSRNRCVPVSRPWSGSRALPPPPSLPLLRRKPCAMTAAALPTRSPTMWRLWWVPPRILPPRQSPGIPSPTPPPAGSPT